MTRIDFDSQIAKRTEFESIRNERKELFSTILNRHSFESIFDGNLVSNRLTALFVSNSGIVASISSLATKISASFVSVSGMVADYTKILISIRPNYKFDSVSGFNATPRLNMGMGSAGFQSVSSFVIRMISRTTLPANKFNSVSAFQSTPSFKQYYNLDDWDASTLSSLDTKTLQEMDYQLV